MNRKAQFDDIKKIILAVVGLIVVIAFVATIYEKVTVRGYDKATCQVSVIANSKARMPLTNSEIWTVDCPTRYLRFVKDGYVEEAGGSQKKIPFKKLNRPITLKDCDGDYDECEYLDQMNKVISEHIFDCWEQFGAGRLSVFSSYTEQKQCVICGVIEFDDDVKREFGRESFLSDVVSEEKTLDEYMRTHGPVGRKITYYEYTQDDLDHFTQEYFDVNFGRSYAVVFRAANQDYLETLGETVVDFFVNNDKWGSWITPDDEETHFVNSLHFIEQEQVVQECDILADQ